MPISDPAQCRDRSEDWLAYFHRRRGAEIAEMIDDDLIREHELNSDQNLGHHSTKLHLVLNYFRNAPVIGKEFVYAVEPYRRYRIGLITARGEKAEVLDDQTYATEKEAVHAVFLARVKRLRAALGASDREG